MSLLPGKLRAEHAQPRAANDWYVEPPEAVEALFQSVRFINGIWDPACGSGTIPKVAAWCGHGSGGSDIVYRGFGKGGIDFLTDETRRPNIVTNPPYGEVAEKFAMHALKVSTLKVALLVRITFLAGQRRRDTLFLPHPPAVVLVLSKRPSMPPGGTEIPAKGGTTDYCWIVWDQDHDGPTLTRWARKSETRNDAQNRH